MKLTIESIGYAHSERQEAIDDNWKDVKSWIELNDNYSEESLSGLQEFSHVEIIYYFHKVNPNNIIIDAEYPRENQNYPKVGIFSQRKKARPNLLGLTICEIIRVEGRKLFVRGFDAIDKTPVIDIKPVFKEYLPENISEVRQPNWVTELMINYW